MQRFPKTARIRNAKEYGEVKKNGIQIRAQAIILSYKLADRRRLGLAVSKKVGGAVERNRIKRVVREFFRLNRDAFPNGDCVVIPTPQAAALNNENLRNNLELALHRLRKK